MFGGLVCDCCELKIAVMHVKAVVKTDNGKSCRIDQDMCSGCWGKSRGRVVTMGHWETFTQYGSGDRVEERQGTGSSESE